MLFWRALARLPGCLRWVPTRPDTSVGRILKKTAVRAVTFHLLGNGCCVLLCSCVVWYSFFFWMCVCILHKEGKEVRNTTYISLVLAVVPRDPFVAFWGFSFAPVTASCRFISKVNKQKSFRQWSASLLEEKLREKHVGATDPMPECSWFWVASVAVQLPREPRSHGLCLCSTEQISSCKAEMFVLVFLLSWYAQHLFFCRSFLWANTRAHPHWGCSCDSKTWSEKQWVVMSWHACTYWFKYSKCHIPYVLRTRTLCFQAKNPQEKKPAIDFNFSLKSGCLHQILFQPENTSGNLPVLLRIVVVFLCAGEELVVFEARPKNMSRLWVCFEVCMGLNFHFNAPQE